VEVFSDGRLVCLPTPLPLPLFGSYKRFPTLFLVLLCVPSHIFPTTCTSLSSCWPWRFLDLLRRSIASHCTVETLCFRVFKKVVEQGWTRGDYFKGVCSQVFCMAFVLLLLYADSLIAFILCWLVSCSVLQQPKIRQYVWSFFS
jgi:hypothetical protein